MQGLPPCIPPPKEQRADPALRKVGSFDVDYAFFV